MIPGIAEPTGSWPMVRPAAPEDCREYDRRADLVEFDWPDPLDSLDNQSCRAGLKCSTALRPLAGPLIGWTSLYCLRP